MFLKNKTKYKTFTDEALLLEYKKSNNKKIITEIFNRYSHLIFGVCLKYNNNKSNCKDVVVIIFEKLINYLAKSKIKSLNSWLYVVTKNECFKQNNLIKNNNFYYAINNDIYEETNNNFNNISDAKVLESIDMLNSEQNKCIKMFYLQNKSYNQISQETGYSIKKVKSYLQNGKRNLKSIIEKQIPKNL